jgi:colanic acid/amylovoran biosynthesis glycosyltransferase
MNARNSESVTRPVIIQRCDRFVARTMNWMYDHLRYLPRHRPLVVTDELQNRQEFPELTAIQVRKYSRARAIWKRISGTDVDPFVAMRLRRFRPLALHSHFGYVAEMDLGLWKALRVPWLVGFYGADVYSVGQKPEGYAPYKPIFEACSYALALGPVMARHIEQLGCPAGKIRVHPLGVEVSDLPDAPRKWKPSEPLKVLFAGTFREKKGLEYAIAGVAAARKAGVAVEVELVGEAFDKPGDRETEARALQLIKDLSLESAIVRHSFLTFRELLALALRCHVFLAPSVTAADGDSEGTPFVLQQMMATAMPAIATHHSDIPYLFGDLSGLLVRERDSQGIAARLQEYAEKPALLSEHGRLLREQILRRFDVRDCASRLSDLYETL